MNQFLELMTAVSSMAEMNGIYFRQLKQNGFTEEQAFELVKVLVGSIIQGGQSDERNS